MSANATMTVGVVVERRVANSPWQDHTWRPVGVLPHATPERGTRLAEGDGWAQFVAGTLELELFRGETEGYLTNLSQDPPLVYVVLRRNEGAEPFEYEPFLATVCPYEAMGYEQGDGEVVEGVPMPPEIVNWVQEFVTRYHVDVPFQKRKNKQHQDDYGGRKPRAERGRDAS
jgi:hypothetical protein